MAGQISLEEICLPLICRQLTSLLKPDRPSRMPFESRKQRADFAHDERAQFPYLCQRCYRSRAAPSKQPSQCSTLPAERHTHCAEKLQYRYLANVLEYHVVMVRVTCAREANSLLQLGIDSTIIEAHTTLHAR